MDKTRITNIQRPAAPFNCDLADGTSLNLLPGKSMVVPDNLLTPYIKRMAGQKKLAAEPVKPANRQQAEKKKEE